MLGYGLKIQNLIKLRSIEELLGDYIEREIKKISLLEDKKTRNFIMVVTKNTALDSYRKRTKSAEQEISVNELNDLDSYAACDSAEEDYEDSTENRVLDIIRNMSDGYKNVFLQL